MWKIPKIFDYNTSKIPEKSTEQYFANNSFEKNISCIATGHPYVSTKKRVIEKTGFSLSWTLKKKPKLLSYWKQGGEHGIENHLVYYINIF